MTIDSPQLTMLLDLLGVEKMQHVRESYLVDSAEKMSALGPCIQSQDWQAVYQLSHSLKSASANLALSDLAGLYAQIEAQSSTAQTDAIPALYEQAQEEYERSVIALKEAF